jgi:two-component system, cell cycle response regulator
MSLADTSRDMTVPLRRRTDVDSTGLPPLRALVAEDDDNYAAYIAALLRRFGFDVTVTSNGTAALAAAQERPFDVAVIDFEMPGMNGLELISAIRSNHRCADMYALMITAHTDLETKVAALRLGYDDFITKSTVDTEMIAKLGAARRLVQRQRRLDATVRELYGLATRDELTGLFNRRHFYAEAERLLAEGCKINLALFDLDDFKKVNDSYGHLAGDQILRDVGTLFLRGTRADDLIARYGGDEFVLVATQATLEEVVALAGRLNAEIAGLRWTFAEEKVCVGATSGVASSTMFEAPTLGQLLAACDRDLYKNKRLAARPSDVKRRDAPPQRVADRR